MSKIINVSSPDLSGENKFKSLFSRTFPVDLINSENSYSFYYIGSKDSFLNPFLFYFNKNKFYHFNPKNVKPNQSAEVILFAKTNRELMRRYYLIEKARDAGIFGILIGTMSVAKYKEAIDHVSNLLRQAKRRFYSFLVGKLNCPKLNNFMEVDMYVLVACNENSLINSKELNKPIITIYELEIAFNSSRLWGDAFIFDYRQLLDGNENYLPLKLSEQESDVSLITGKSRHNDFSTAAAKTNDQLISRDEGLAVIHHAGAGQFIFFYLNKKILKKTKIFLKASF